MKFFNLQLGWQLNYWIPYAIYLGLIIYFIIKYFKNKTLSSKIINRGFFIVLLIIILQWAVQILLFYFILKKDPSGLGEYLLTDQNGYFYQNALRMAASLIYTFGPALFIFIFFYILHKIRKEILSLDSIKLITLLALICSYPTVVYFIAFGLILIFFTQIYMLVFKRSGLATRINADIFFLIAALIALISSTFISPNL